MPRSKISQLAAAAALTGAELVEVVQSGGNKQTTTQAIANLGGGSADGPQAANTVKAGPTSGPAAPPAYRVLVVNDLPNIPFSKIISGTIPANTTVNTNDKTFQLLVPDDGFIIGEVLLELGQSFGFRLRNSIAAEPTKFVELLFYEGNAEFRDTRTIKKGYEVADSSYGSGYTDKSYLHRLYADNRYALLYRAKSATYLTNSLTAGDAVNIAAVANSLRTCPLVITKPITFTQIDSCVNGAVGGTTYRLALYTDLNGYPDAIVAGSDNAAYDSSSTGTKASGAVSIALTPGLYHIAYNSNGGPLLAGWSNVSQPQVLGISSITSGSTPNVSWMVNTAYGAMPATFPVGATLLAANAVKIGLLI